MDKNPAGLPMEEPYIPLPSGFMSSRAREIALALGSRVIGQPEAIAELAIGFEYALADIRDPSRPNKPVAVFMLMGPSGVGKTEAAKALAESVLGSASRLKVVDCTQLQESHEAATLKGSPYGYIGSDEPPELCQFYLDLGYLEQKAESGEYFESMLADSENSLKSAKDELIQVQQEILEKTARIEAWKSKLEELKQKPAKELIAPERDAIPIYEERIQQAKEDLKALDKKEKEVQARASAWYTRVSSFKKILKWSAEQRLAFFRKNYCDKSDILEYNKSPDPKAKSVVLFDEIEKAHESVTKMLLGVLNDGILQLRNGGQANFRNSIIIFTSNLGTEEIRKLLQGAAGPQESCIGFPCHRSESDFFASQAKTSEFRAAIREICFREFRTFFSTPFVRRVGRRICFQPLQFGDMLEILGRFVRDFNLGSGATGEKRSVSVPLTLVLSRELQEFIVRKAIVNWEEGAGRIYDMFQEHVLDRLIPLLNGGVIQSHDLVYGTLAEDAPAFFRKPGKPPEEDIPVLEPLNE
jgi:guanylate kinase